MCNSELNNNIARIKAKQALYAQGLHYCHCCNRIVKLESVINDYCAECYRIIDNDELCLQKADLNGENEPY